jgi:pimeloyl-ACP methyl ester carboxylesterase
MQLHSRIIGEGRPLLILHGFLGSGDNWKTLAKQFAQEGFQVHLVDQRNHGRSFHAPDFSYELMVADLKAYSLYHGLDNFSLIGHSMGGKTAMLFACDHSEMLDKLIVADIGPKFYPQHHQVILEGLKNLSQNSEALSSRKNADQFLGNYIKEIGVRMFLLKNLYWKEPNILGLRVNLEALITNIEEIGKPLDALKRYQGDTLFLKGERSDYILEEDEIDIMNAFAKAQIKTIPKAGHWLHAENPTDFYQEVINFL